MGMEPFYFGPTDRRLFGVYHPPLSEVDSGVGVVLCTPVGDEYLRSHSALLKLADRLARAGIHVLRFDYRGCGDSELGFEAGDLEAWVEDIGTALRELRDGSGASRLGLCGLRLGGSLAALAAMDHEDVFGVVLWDAIVDGTEHLSALRDRHREWVRGSFAKGAVGEDEILGYRYSPALVTTLQQLDLRALTPPPQTRILLLDTQESEIQADLHRQLQERGAGVDFHRIRRSPIWLKRDDLNNVAVPMDVLDDQIAWVARCLK